MAFTIGCDPELVCRLDGLYTPARRYFKFKSSFGLDGCDSIAELRPGYSESPIDLTSKIYQIIEYGHNKYPELEFYSGHYVDDLPIGGHIHISIEPTNKTINALDTVLGSLSNCIDDKTQRIKRERSGYGKRGSYRRKPYGFEYRTPGSFLLSPATALVTITLAKLSILGVLEDNIDFVELKQRRHSCTFLRDLKHNLRTIPRDCKEGLKQLDCLLAKKWDWNQNIIQSWGMANQGGAI